MQIVQLRDDDAKQWDEYVRVRSGTVTDLYAWREIVRKVYGLRSHFLAAFEDNRIVGTLGLFEIKHPIFGHYLTTAVFGNDGGLHFDDAPARDALLAAARDLTDGVNAEYLLIRTRELELDGFRVDRNYRTAVIDLDGGNDAVWSRLPAKTRNQVRRGLKEGFTVETGHDQLEAFYRVFHQHMRDLGSPAHGRKYYKAILEQLGDCTDFLVVMDRDKAVAGALLFWMNETAMNYHTVSLREYNRRCPNYLLYWRMLEVSCKRGCTQFDMGRSRFDSSNLKFKQNWNPQEIALSYNYYLRKSKEVPNLDPRNPKYRVQIALWRKMPVFVTRALGPRLISGLA